MYIQVKVTPKSRQESFVQTKPLYFEARIKEEAKRGQANARILELLREHFPQARQIRIISGQHSPKKLISVDLD